MAKFLLHLKQFLNPMCLRLNDRAIPVPTISITGTKLGIPDDSDISSSGGPCPKYLLRADMRYDWDTNIMTAVMEAPGIRKADFEADLRTCPFTRHRLVKVTGKNQPGDGTWAFQERRYGEFYRLIIVPIDTKVSQQYLHT